MKLGLLMDKTLPIEDENEINLLEYFYVLVKYKWLLLFVMICGGVGGHFIALEVGPTYVADTVIAPKPNKEKSMPSSLSGLGLLSGVVSGLNFGGGTSLDQIYKTLESRSFKGKLVNDRKLTPLILHKHIDSTGGWKDGVKIPDSRIVGAIFSNENLEYEIAKNMMTLTVSHPDSLASIKLLNETVSFLDIYIRNKIQHEANKNRVYLEKQLIAISDPLLQTKIQELIAQEVEQMMMVSNEAFDIVDSVFVVKTFREKRVYPFVGAVGLLFLFVVIILLTYIVKKYSKNETDQYYMTKIKQEILRFPFFKRK